MPRRVCMLMTRTYFSSTTERATYSLSQTTIHTMPGRCLAQPATYLAPSAFAVLRSQRLFSRRVLSYARKMSMISLCESSHIACACVLQGGSVYVFRHHASLPVYFENYEVPCHEQDPHQWLMSVRLLWMRLRFY